MRAIRSCAFFVGACVAGSGSAGGIARCVGAHGEAMFAQTCAATARAVDSAPLRSTLPIVGPGRGGVGSAGLCAHTPQQLAERVQAALHARNGVRLSGYALRRGFSAGGARGEVRALLHVLKAAVADVQLRQRDDAAYPELDAPPLRSGEHALVIATLGGQGSDLRSGERWFGVVRDHGCYWLTLAPPAWVDDESPDGGMQADAAALAWER